MRVVSAEVMFWANKSATMHNDLLMAPPSSLAYRSKMTSEFMRVEHIELSRLTTDTSPGAKSRTYVGPTPRIVSEGEMQRGESSRESSCSIVCPWLRRSTLPCSRLDPFTPKCTIPTSDMDCTHFFHERIRYSMSWTAELDSTSSMVCDSWWWRVVSGSTRVETKGRPESSGARSSRSNGTPLPSRAATQAYTAASTDAASSAESPTNAVSYVYGTPPSLHDLSLSSTRYESRVADLVGCASSHDSKF